MWFLIRAVFWLAVVFSFMSWPGDSRLHSSLHPPLFANWAKAREAISAAVGEARATGAKLCANSPIACLAAATGLSQPDADRPTDETGLKARPGEGGTGSPPGIAIKRLRDGTP